MFSILFTQVLLTLIFLFHQNVVVCEEKVNSISRGKANRLDLLHVSDKALENVNTDEFKNIVGRNPRSIVPILINIIPHGPVIAKTAISVGKFVVPLLIQYVNVILMRKLNDYMIRNDRNHTLGASENNEGIPDPTPSQRYLYSYNVTYEDHTSKVYNSTIHPLDRAYDLLFQKFEKIGRIIDIHIMVYPIQDSNKTENSSHTMSKNNTVAENQHFKSNNSDNMANGKNPQENVSKNVENSHNKTADAHYKPLPHENKPVKPDTPSSISFSKNNNNHRQENKNMHHNNKQKNKGFNKTNEINNKNIAFNETTDNSPQHQIPFQQEKHLQNEEKLPQNIPNHSTNDSQITNHKSQEKPFAKSKMEKNENNHGTNHVKSNDNTIDKPSTTMNETLYGEHADAVSKKKTQNLPNKYFDSKDQTQHSGIPFKNESRQSSGKLSSDSENGIKENDHHTPLSVSNKPLSQNNQKQFENDNEPYDKPFSNANPNLKEDNGMGGSYSDDSLNTIRKNHHPRPPFSKNNQKQFGKKNVPYAKSLSQSDDNEFKSGMDHPIASNNGDTNSHTNEYVNAPRKNAHHRHPFRSNVPVPENNQKQFEKEEEAYVKPFSQSNHNPKEFKSGMDHPVASNNGDENDHHMPPFRSNDRVPKNNRKHYSIDNGPYDKPFSKTNHMHKEYESDDDDPQIQHNRDDNKIGPHHSDEYPHIIRKSSHSNNENAGNRF